MGFTRFSGRFLLAVRHASAKEITGANLLLKELHSSQWGRQQLLERTASLKSALVHNKTTPRSKEALVIIIIILWLVRAESKNGSTLNFLFRHMGSTRIFGAVSPCRTIRLSEGERRCQSLQELWGRQAASGAGA